MANEFIARKGLIVPSGSILVSSGSVTASHFVGTASAAISASYTVTSSYATTASAVPTAIFTASAAGSTITFTKGNGETFQTTITTATAESASYIEYNNVASKPTLVSASSQIDVRNTIGIATLATTGSNTFIGNQVISGSLITIADTVTFNGSMVVSGGSSITGSINVFNGGVTSSLLGTSSWANNAISSSYATTSSYALNASGTGFPFSGSAIITGSLYVTGSTISGSFVGDGSGLTNVDVASAVINDIYKFVGNGSTQLYVLSQSYLADNLQVSVDGLVFTPDVDYAYTTGSITFVEAPPSSSNILVTALLNTKNNLTGSFTGSFIGDGRGLINLPSAVTIDNYEFIGNGNTTNYILDHPYASNSLFVSVDGLGFNPSSDYSISGSTIVFTSAPPSESIVFIKGLVNTGNNVTGSFSGSFFGSIPTASYALTASYVAGDAGITDWSEITNIPIGIVSSSIQVTALLPTGTVSSSTQVNTGSFSFTQLPNISIVADNHAFVGDGTTTIYTLSQSYSPAILTVSVDGLVNTLTEDYTVSTNQLTLVSAPPSSSNILVKGIRIALI